MAEEGKGTPVLMPMVGKIIAVQAKVGDLIKENEVIVIMEAMKMEMPIVAPRTGRIKEVNVSVGQSVKSGEVIAIIE